MFGLRLVSFCVAALVCGTINVAAVPPRGGHGGGRQGPPPVYQPQYGEVVHVAPSQTSGGSVGTGADVPHPHVALGHDHTGNVIVAPATHNTHSDHLKPIMPAPPGSGLGGGVRLDHIVAHPQAISQSRGQLRNKVLSSHDVSNIQDAKSLVGAHRNAAAAHNMAAQAHRTHENFHNTQSAHHFQTGNAQAGAHHSNLATTHAGHAQRHETAAANHHSAANNVTGPDANALHHATQSANHAHGVHQSFSTASQHDQAAHAAHQQGNHPAAAHHSQQAHNLRQTANQASTASIHSHNSATGHHL